MTWENKPKTLQQADEVILLTPDEEEILVGEDSDQVLMCQLAYTFWSLLAK